MTQDLPLGWPKYLVLCCVGMLAIGVAVLALGHVLAHRWMQVTGFFIAVPGFFAIWFRIWYLSFREMGGVRVAVAGVSVLALLVMCASASTAARVAGNLELSARLERVAHASFTVILVGVPLSFLWGMFRRKEQ